MQMLLTTIAWNTAVAGALGGLVWTLQRTSWLKRRPGITHVLWFLVTLKLVSPPIFNIPVVPSFQRPSAAAVADGDNSLGLPSLPASDPASLAESGGSLFSTALLGIGLSLTGSAILLGMAVVRSRRMARLVRLAENGPQWLQAWAITARGRSGGRLPRVKTLDGCLSPFLWVGRDGPVVVVPAALVERLSRLDLELIVTHELLHYARKDHWANAFSIAVVGLQWWNPVAWWARRELRFSQEVCCDAAVVAAHQQQRRRYAEALLRTVDFLASADKSIPVPATAFGSCSTFKRRIEMISRRDLSSSVPWATRSLLAVLGALLLVATPGLAHDDRDEEVSRMRGEIRELQAKVDELTSVLRELTRDRRSTDDDRADRPLSRLSRQRLDALANRARLGEDERAVMWRLAESVDMNARQFERLRLNDDLNDAQSRVISKLFENASRFRDDDDRREDDDRRDDDRRDDDRRDDDRRDRIVRLTKQQLMRFAERADLNADERQVLMKLAESVDMNARQFERLLLNDDLNRAQRRVLRKISSDD